MKISSFILFCLFSFSCAHREVAKTHQHQEEQVHFDASSFHPRLHFKSGSDELQNDAKLLLIENAQWMKAHPLQVFVLEGHADERGETFYNLLLGDRRARKIKSLLMKEGVHEQQTIMIVSQGEAKPLNKNHGYKAWKENRRVEFILR